ncbi:MAG: lipid-binding SYLF domain-containing protein [Acidobacteriota bacterium]|nr:lipid-binding SYLF domain-containing protein [Acidobacteriota bacterium]
MKPSPPARRVLPTFLCTLIVLGATLWPLQAQEDRNQRKVRTALEVYRELVDLPEKNIPAKLLSEARCIAVIPSVIKGAFVWGGKRGRGVMTCRQEEGWSPIVFVKLSGGSFGFQIGGESTDLVLFFLTDRGVRSLLTSKLVLGGNASVAAGPLGRTAEIGTDARLKAEIFSYAKSRGVFAGISIEGARLAADHSWNTGYYGSRVWPDELLFGDARPPAPAGMNAFLAALP